MIEIEIDVDDADFHPPPIPAGMPTFSDREARILWRLLQALPSAPRILEIGTSHGAGTIRLAAARPDADLHTLNIRPGEVKRFPRQGEIIRERLIGSAARAAGVKFTQHLGDSLDFDFVALAPIDAVFIDGCHERDYVISDTRRVLPAMARGGLVIWHDVSDDDDLNRECKAAVEQLNRTLFAGGVVHVRGTRLAYMQYFATHNQ